MRFAGRLLTAGDPSDPNVTLEALLTDVGGFEQNGENARLGQDPNAYRHSGAETHVVGLRGDETTNRNHSFERRPVTAADHDDLSGTTNRDAAIGRTINGHRASGQAANTIRGRVARRLVKHATKGVGTQPYTK